MRSGDRGDPSYSVASGVALSCSELSVADSTLCPSCAPRMLAPQGRPLDRPAGSEHRSGWCCNRDVPSIPGPRPRGARPSFQSHPPGHLGGQRRDWSAQEQACQSMPWLLGITNALHGLESTRRRFSACLKTCGRVEIRCGGDSSWWPTWTKSLVDLTARPCNRDRTAKIRTSEEQGRVSRPTAAKSTARSLKLALATVVATPSHFMVRTRRHRFQVLVLAAGALILSGISAAPALADLPLTWSSRTVIDPSDPFSIPTYLLDVSCPSATLCVAVDSSGNVVTSTNPTGGAAAWHIAHVDGDNRLQRRLLPLGDALRRGGLRGQRCHRDQPDRWGGGVAHRPRRRRPTT